MLESVVSITVMISAFLGMMFMGYGVASYWKSIPIIEENRSTVFGIALVLSGASGLLTTNFLPAEKRWILTAAGLIGLLLGVAAGLRSRR